MFHDYIVTTLGLAVSIQMNLVDGCKYRKVISK